MLELPGADADVIAKLARSAADTTIAARDRTCITQVQSGNTAVTSISTLARSSTSAAT